MDHQPHTIRLDSVWTPPCAGGAEWVRHFGRPSGIDPGMRVVLVIESPAVSAIALNHTPLPAPAPGVDRWAHDITALLAARNELSLMPSTAPVDDLLDKVAGHGRAPLPAGCGSVTLQILTSPATGQ